jgi:hypothetical protein
MREGGIDITSSVTVQNFTKLSTFLHTFPAPTFVKIGYKKVKGKAVSTVTGLGWPRGFQEVKVPRFHDNGTGWWQGTGPEGSRKLRFPDFMTTAQDGGKVVSLTHRPPLPPENKPRTHFCYRLSRPHGHSATGRMSLKNSNDTIGNRTSDRMHESTDKIS